MPDLFNDANEKTAEQDDLISLIRNYIQTLLQLGKLSLIERLTTIMANLITDGIMVILLALVFLFGSIALGFYLGEVVGSTAGGFGLVTLIYLFFTIFMHFTKDRYIEKHLINFMIKRFTQKKK